MKKIMALFLAVVMCLSFCVACGSTDNGSEETEKQQAATAEEESAEPEEETESEKEAEPEKETTSPEEEAKTTEETEGEASEIRHKIGVILYGKDDAFGAAEYAYINSVAEALAFDVVWALGDYDAESQLASAENLVSAGCEGLLFLPVVDNTVGLISDYCLENEIWFAMMNRTIADPEIKEACEANPYYIGTSTEANDAATADLANMFVENGCLNLGFGKFTPGSSLSTRNDVFEKTIGESEATILADFILPNDGTTESIATSVENLATSFSELDGIFLAGGAAGRAETTINTLKRLVDTGSVKIATFDTFDGMEEGFADGWLLCVAGGIEIQCVYDAVMLFNAVDGTPLAEEPITLEQGFIYITSPDDCENYTKYISTPDYMIYDADTIRTMAKRYNPDASMDTIYDLMSDYSLESVVANAQ